MQDITMAFDPELGERAMLIRNHAGDWGLCIARWLLGMNNLYIAKHVLSRMRKIPGYKIKRSTKQLEMC